MPGTLRTPSGQIFAFRSSGPISVSPSGLFMSEAIFARRLLHATPIEQVSPVSPRMQRLMSRAMASAGRSLPVTSR
jgi:hypothetical protein